MHSGYFFFFQRRPKGLLWLLFVTGQRDRADILLLCTSPADIWPDFTSICSDRLMPVPNILLLVWIILLKILNVVPLLWTESCPSPTPSLFICWSPDPPVWLYVEIRSLQKQFRLYEVMKVGSWSDKISVLIRRDTRELILLLPHKTMERLS